MYYYSVKFPPKVLREVINLHSDKSRAIRHAEYTSAGPFATIEIAKESADTFLRLFLPTGFIHSLRHTNGKFYQFMPLEPVMQKAVTTVDLQSDLFYSSFPHTRSRISFYTVVAEGWGDFFDGNEAFSMRFYEVKL